MDDDNKNRQSAQPNVPPAHGGWRWVGLLLVLNLISAMLLIHSTHESRLRYSELARLEAQAEQLQVRWGQLLLEQSTHAAHARIEELARARLDMRAPRTDETVLIKP